MHNPCTLAPGNVWVTCTINNKTICNYCGKEKDDVQTGICSHCGRFGQTNRELAIKWWRSLTFNESYVMFKKYYPGREHKSVTGFDIAYIWHNETKSGEIYSKGHDGFPEDDIYNHEICPKTSDIESQADEVERIGFENLKPKEQQVDFEMLNRTVKFIDSLMTKYVPALDVERKNLQLFFKLLSTKPTFAQVVHKKLNKLS